VDNLIKYKTEILFLTWNTLRSVLHNGWWLLVSLYLVVDIHFNATQLLLIAVAQGVVSVLFEVPAGVFADTVSRKWSIVISHILMGTAMLTTSLFNSFFLIVVTQMLWGISWTFTSGADVAWITDELDEPNKIHIILVRTARRQFAGAGMGMVIFACLAYVIGRREAIFLAGILMLMLGLFVAIKFSERGFIRTKTRRFKAAISIIRVGTGIVMKDRIILLLVLITLLINGAGDAFSRIYPIIIESLGLSTGSIGTIAFGAISIGSYIIGALALVVIEKRVVYQIAAKIALLLACGFGAISLGIIAAAPSITVAIFGVLLANGIAMPISRTVTTIWVNQRCESNVRAMIHSLLSQAEYLGEITFGLTISWVARLHGASGALGCSCILFVIAFIILIVNKSSKGAH